MFDFLWINETRLWLCSLRLRLTGNCDLSTSACLSPSMWRRPCFRGSQDSSAQSRHWKKARPMLPRTRPLWMSASAFSSKESMCCLFGFGCCCCSVLFHLTQVKCSTRFWDIFSSIIIWICGHWKFDACSQAIRLCLPSTCILHSIKGIYEHYLQSGNAFDRQCNGKPYRGLHLCLQNKDYNIVTFVPAYTDSIFYWSFWEQ